MRASIPDWEHAHDRYRSVYSPDQWSSSRQRVWQVGSSATLGADTAFYGSILADQSITMDTGASMSGRALALNGAVTLDDNVITAENDIISTPEPGTIWLLASCASVFGVWRRLAPWRRKLRRS